LFLAEYQSNYYLLIKVFDGVFSAVNFGLCFFGRFSQEDRPMFAGRFAAIPLRIECGFTVLYADYHCIVGLEINPVLGDDLKLIHGVIAVIVLNVSYFCFHVVWF
jgi:hypothetical protein